MATISVKLGFFPLSTKSYKVLMTS